MDKPKAHPAKYSNALLPILKEALEGYGRILDPMAGTGKIRLIRPDAFINELEKEWIEQAPRGEDGAETVLGDALSLPWSDNYFDAAVTSPTYGNRMADHHKAKDSSKRNTYTHTLGRELSENNSGKIQWGEAYLDFHRRAWTEIWRVLRPEGRFVLNVSDHIRKGAVMPVTFFHKAILFKLGFDLTEAHRIRTPRQRQGENGELRVEYESVLVFDKPAMRRDFIPYLMNWTTR